MIRRYATILLAISLIILSAVFTGGNVKAESVYDGVYQSVDDLYYSSERQGINGVNISTDWAKLILDDEGIGDDIKPTAWKYPYAGDMSQQQIDDLRQSFRDTIANPNGSWFVSVDTWGTDNGYGYDTITIGWSSSFMSLNWSLFDVTTNVTDYLVTIAPSAPPYSNKGYEVLVDSRGVNNTTVVWKPTFLNFIANLDPNYPEGYEGELLQTGYEPVGEKTELKPDYAWKVDADGKLTIQYLDNIKPTLTGFVYPVVEKMTDDWEALDVNIQANQAWRINGFNQSFTLPSAGYYMFRMDYDQTFDTPPWQPNDDRKYEVAQIWIQFYWDGSSVISGNSTQCKAGEICNKDKAPPGEFFLGLNIDTKGLTGVLLAPIRFVNAMNPSECQPINAELVGKPVNLPCLTPIYMGSIAPLVVLWQTIITGGVGYLVGINIFSRLKKTVSPQDDSIEVMKL